MAGTHSYGTTFSFGGAISYVQKISGPKVKITQSNATHLTSTNARMEFKSGFVDEGQFTLTCLYDKTVMNTLRGLARSDATSFTLTWPDGSTYTGTANLEGIDSETPEDDMIMADVTIKITGNPTFTAAS